MLMILKFLLFITILSGFGAVSLSQITKITSSLFLIPFSPLFGFASYIFICHLLSFLIGPKLASIITLLFLFLFSVFIILFKKFKYNHFHKIENEINKKQFTFLSLFALIISILSYFAMDRFSVFDKEFHIPLAITIFHNNVYPPRDFYRPEYIILYHYGGDLLSGAINYLTKLEISTSFEVLLSVLSGITFLCYFILAWILTKNYKISFIAGFCSYFGGGLLWLDAFIRYIFKLSPVIEQNWDFLQTLLNIGTHGGILDAPSINAFISTMGIGTPILIFSLVLFWEITKESKNKEIAYKIIFLNISLFSLFLCAEWLFVTFWACIIPFVLFQAIKKQTKLLLPTLLILIISIVLNKSIGNALFLQNSVQQLGRTNIFDISIKKNLFWIMSWGRLTSNLMDYQAVNCFSWEFVSAFGLSIFLFPIVIIYLIKNKNPFSFLLFLIPLITMPVPTIIDFKINPVDLNRFFNFGNTILVLLITCGICILFKSFLKNNFLISLYIIAFCLSPITGLISASVFTPHIFSNKPFVQEIMNNFRQIKSFDDTKKYIVIFNKAALKAKYTPRGDFENEINFLKIHSKPLDVAISSVTDIPAYAGIYSLIPAGKWLYKDLIYSPFDSIFISTITSLDPYLLDELNIKWLLISNTSKNSLPEDAKNNLNNPEIFKLAYVSPDKNKLSQNWYEIYHTESLKPLLKNLERKTAWILVNKYGQPVEIMLELNKISLFKSSKEALNYLNNLLKTYPELKKVLITSQATIIQNLQNQISQAKTPIRIEKNY